MKVFRSLALGLVLGCAGTAAQAIPIAYDFTVTANDGPLAGTSSSGFFTFDDGVIPGGGGLVSATGLLTDLAFSWNGIAYTEATANTGWLTFDAAGILISFGFGNNCSAGTCTILGGTNQWFATPALFGYAMQGQSGIWTAGTMAFRLRQVVEPGTLGMLGLALLGLAVSRRRA